MIVPLTLPAKIYLADFDNDFTAFLEAVYKVFHHDFVETSPQYEGFNVRLKKYPLELGGKEHTFYHITHEGSDERNRVPSIPRMERIAYPRCFIDNAAHQDLLVWKNMRHNEERILIYHPDERYLVVLANRKTYVLLWTAYVATYNHTHRKLMREYNSYKNAL